MGSSPIVGSRDESKRVSLGQCPERQRGRTVNPLGDALRRFESYLAHQDKHPACRCAFVAQSVEHALGKGEAMGSNPIEGSGFLTCRD